MSEKEVKIQLRKNILESETNRAFQKFMTIFIIGFTLLIFTVGFWLEKSVPTLPFSYTKDNLSFVAMIGSVVFLFILATLFFRQHSKLKREVYSFVGKIDPDFEFVKEKLEK